MALISKSHVRSYALEFAARVRPANKFRRVSKKFLEATERDVRLFVEDRIRRHPSRGVTLE